MKSNELKKTPIDEALAKLLSGMNEQGKEKMLVVAQVAAELFPKSKLVKDDLAVHEVIK